MGTEAQWHSKFLTAAQRSLLLNKWPTLALNTWLCMQAVAWCVLLPLLPLVPVKEGAVVLAGQQPGAGHRSGQQQDELTEPLLPRDEGRS
jgi:hypothetical protein